MFRGMRRKKQQISEEECVALLELEKRGVLSVVGDDGYPYGVPVDFIYEEGTIYIHGAKQGHKIDAIRACDKVCFTTWNSGCKKAGNWYWTLQSVIAFGRAELVEDRMITEEMTRKLGLKYYPSAEAVDEEMARDISRVQLIAVHIEHLSGKLVNEK